MPKRRRRSPGAAALIAGVLLMATVACSAGPTPEEPTDESEQSESAEPTADATPLAAYDTSGVTIVRAAFCDRVAEGAVAAALSGGASELGDASVEDAWQPGSRLPGSKDIGNEFGCSWTAGQVTARAWVFAPPVTPQRASDLVREVVGDKCRRMQAAGLGRPSVSQRCEGAGTTGIYGLVGDAWVSCEITGLTSTGSEDLVGEWCVAVLEALRSV